HICVPMKMLEGNGFTRGDFVDAYLAVSELRWQSALESLSKDDEKASMNSLARILHGVIDAYWPGRVQRDSEGAITQFRDCDELGSLQGMLQEERTGRGPAPAERKEATNTITQIVRKWKERTSFDEVAP